MDQAEICGRHGTAATAILQPLPMAASAAPAKTPAVAAASVTPAVTPAVGESSKSPESDGVGLSIGPWSRLKYIRLCTLMLTHRGHFFVKE